MKNQFSKWLSILLPICLGIFLTVYSYNQFSDSQILEIKSYFKNANYFVVIIAVIIAFFGNAARAYRWKYALNHLGYESSFENNFMAVNIGYLLNLSVPKSGEISRALIVKKYNNIPFDKGFGTIVAERIIDMMILLLFMLLAIFLQFDIVKAFILDKIPIKIVVLFCGFSVVLFFFFLWLYFYSKWQFIETIKHKISGLKEGLFSIFKMQNKEYYFLQTALIWLSYLLTFYVASYVIPETSTLSIGAIITSFVVGSIAIAFTNSGFGSYPFLISKMLLFYNIAETAGNAFGWIIWTSQMFLVLFLGLISFIYLPIYNRKKLHN